MYSLCPLKCVLLLHFKFSIDIQAILILNLVKSVLTDFSCSPLFSPWTSSFGGDLKGLIGKVDWEKKERNRGVGGCFEGLDRSHAALSLLCSKHFYPQWNLTFVTQMQACNLSLLMLVGVCHTWSCKLGYVCGFMKLLWQSCDSAVQRLHRMLLLCGRGFSQINATGQGLTPNPTSHLELNVLQKQIHSFYHFAVEIIFQNRGLVL